MQVERGYGDRAFARPRQRLAFGCDHFGISLLGRVVGVPERVGALRLAMGGRSHILHDGYGFYTVRHANVSERARESYVRGATSRVWCKAVLQSDTPT